jgi:hypothetical protein
MLCTTVKLTHPRRRQALAEYSAVVSSERRGRSYGRALALAASVLAVAATCLVAMGAGSSSAPVESSMYHLWLGPNGLPESPRKQRGLLFQFCTTNFVTEAEMRYCYARMLGDGNPSGPVKYAGQAGYDSEQVVAPLFTFAPPAGEGGAEGGSEAAAAPARLSQQGSKMVALHEAATRALAARK